MINSLPMYSRIGSAPKLARMISATLAVIQTADAIQGLAALNDMREFRRIAKCLELRPAIDAGEEVEGVLRAFAASQFRL